MKWCNNPLEENDSLYLKESPINHLRWLNDIDSSEDFHVYRGQSSKRAFLIACWKQKGRFEFHRSANRKQKLVVPKKGFLTKKFLVLDQP